MGTGTQPDYLSDRADEKNVGPLRERVSTKGQGSREILAVRAVGVLARIEHDDKGRESAWSWNQYQMRIDCLCCHIPCAHCSTIKY